MPDALVRLRLLGGFELSVDGTPVLDQSWSRKKPLALLKILALQPGREMSRDQLFARLWPDVSQTAAATQLRKNRLFLRRELAEAGYAGELIEAADGVIRLAKDVVADTDAFVASARAALSRISDAGLLAQALESYGGELLPDDRAEEWTEPSRADLRALYHRTALALSRQLETSASYERAIDVARRVIASDPLDEEGHRALMRLYAVSGRRDLALQQYEACRRTLREELDAAPDEETERLVSRIRSQTMRQTAYTPSATPLVGRTDEIQRLHAAFEQARAGASQVALLSGEAGIGKTRLAEAFAAYAQQSGARVHWLRSYADESERGFGHWIELIGTLAGISVTDAGRSASGGQPASRMHALLASSSTEPDAMFAQVCAFLREHARRQPLVLIFDDLQWCGADSLQLLRVVIRDVRDAPLMIVGTARVEAADLPPEAAPFIEELQRDRRCHALSLAGLSVEDVEGLISLIATHELSPPARDLWERTRGNPLFVTEIVRATKGELTRALSRVALPPKITGVMRHRISHLSAELRELLEDAAVIGGEFSLPILARSTALDPASVPGLIEEACASDIVVQVAPGAERYAFAHPLMLDVVYGGVPPARLAQTHLRVARALEKHYGDAASAHASELAHHFRHALPAGGEDDALRYLREAGLQSLAELAFDDAARHFEAALEISLSRRPADHAQHAEIRLGLASALYRTHDTTQRQRMMDVLDSALDDARASGSAPLFVRVVSAITGRRKSGIGVSTEKIALLKEALAMVGDDDLASRCDLSGLLAKELEGDGDDASRRAAGNEAIALARRMEPCDISAQAMLNGLDAIAGPDALDERLSLTEELVRFSLPRGESITIRAHLRRYATLLEAGDVNGADRELACIVDASKSHPVSTVRLWAERWSTVISADRLISAGRFDDAEELARRGASISESIDDPDAVSILGSQLFQIRWHHGRLAELSGIASAVLKMAPDFWPWKVASVLIQLSNGEEQSARIAFERIAGGGFRAIPRDRFWSVTMTVAAELCAYFDDRERARELLRLIEPFAQRVAVLGYGQVCSGSLARTAGLLCATLGEWTRARDYFEEALRVNAAIGAATWVAWTELQYGQMLLRHGDPADRDRALALLSSSAMTARECRMTTVLANAEQLLAAG